MNERRKISLAQVIAFAASAPSTISGSLNRTIPLNPNSITLSQFGFYLTENADQVFLDGTIGVQAAIINPTITLRIFDENDRLVYSSTEQFQLSIGQTQTINFHAIDSGRPAGFRVYTLTASSTDLLPILTSATVTGPLTFSAMALKN